MLFLKNGLKGITVRMELKWRRGLVVLVGATLAAWAAGQANVKRDADIVKELSDAISKVRTTTTSSSRTRIALSLTDLTRKINPNDIDDETLTNLVSLLDTWDDSVRDAVALSLGNLGPRAKSALPKLLEALSEVDCLWIDASAAADIRNAIKRIGSQPPPAPKCETAVDPIVWKQRLTDAIATVRTSKSSAERGKAAMHIGYLIFWLGRNEIDDKTIADLVSLLDIPEEPVREGVARSLGFLGSRAKLVAGPKLKELLSGLDCHPEEIDLANAVRSALTQMDVKVLPPRCAVFGTSCL
jgi:HEAT repeat protein